MSSRVRLLEIAAVLLAIGVYVVLWGVDALLFVALAVGAVALLGRMAYQRAGGDSR